MGPLHPHLADLRRLAAQSRAAALDIQRELASKLMAPPEGGRASELEMRASNTLLQLMAAIDAMYLQELRRCNAVTLDHIRRRDPGRTGHHPNALMLRANTEAASSVTVPGSTAAAAHRGTAAPGPAE
ncbi:hypothetical protein [Variovorax sp. W1I1]|uniref:hypothetical protein n=1 Tax=Variovorax sp. W1I1 TaxID=3042309 RepID=UPI0027D8D844|nr:hypothetical protein [Variovorax sp. W1I1]